MQSEAQADADISLRVVDTTCTQTHPQRTHEIVVDGAVVSYTFHLGSATTMPYAHAMKFLKHKEFMVQDEGGKRIEPIPVVNRAAPEVPKLADDEVVAKLDELTVDSLVRRANMVNGGEKLRQRDGKEALIRFLLGAARAERAAAVPAKAPPATGDLDDIEDPRELAKLFDDDGA